MKTQKQLERETVKMTAECLSMVSDGLKSVSDGLDLSRYKDDGIPDGYIYIHAECIDTIDDDGIIALARSLRIKQVAKARPEYIRVLLNLSKEEVESNNIFTAAQTKNGDSQVVMFWKCC